MKTLVVGNTLAAMMTASLLAEDKNNEVTLLRNVDQWGGFFWGFDFENQTFDNGNVLFELTTYAKEAGDVSDYRPRVKYDVGRFVGNILQFFNELKYSIHEIPTPKTMFREQLVDDFVLCNNFEVLNLLTDVERETIKNELGPIASQKSVLHPTHKKEASYDRYDLKSASIANHGKTLHSLIIEPFVEKLLSLPSSVISASFHRVLWLPIYYPETLLAQLGPNPVRLPKTVCHYPSQGNIRTFVNLFVNRLKSQNMRSLVSTPEKVNMDTKTVTIKGGEVIKFDELFWGMSHEPLVKERDNNVRKNTSTSLVHLVVDSTKIDKNQSVVYFPAKDRIAYRFSNQTACSGQNQSTSLVTVEFNTEYGKKHGLESPDAFIQNSIDLLKSVSFIHKDSAVKKSCYREIVRGRQIPSLDAAQLFDETLNEVEKRYPGIHLLGAPSGFANSSINDQIVHSLKYAKDFCRK